MATTHGNGTRRRHRSEWVIGGLCGLLQIGVCGISADVAVAQNSGLGTASGARTAEYNAEWVESSSPVTGGGVVTTTHFPGSGNTLTTVRDPGVGMGVQRPQMMPVGANPTAAAIQPNAAFQANSAFQPGVTAPAYAAIPTGNGGYLTPTVQYTTAANPAMAPYQVAGVPYNCANCQTPMMVQPTAFQPAMMPQQPLASQPPVLPPTAGGVYGPIQPQMGGAPVGYGTPGFYAQPQANAATANGQGGYRALIPRSLPAGTYIGQGWLGQPKAYVSSQPFRNFLRYLIVP